MAYVAYRYNGNSVLRRRWEGRESSKVIFSEALRMVKGCGKWGEPVAGITYHRAEFLPGTRDAHLFKRQIHLSKDKGQLDKRQIHFFKRQRRIGSELKGQSYSSTRANEKSWQKCQVHKTLYYTASQAQQINDNELNRQIHLRSCWADLMLSPSNISLFYHPALEFPQYMQHYSVRSSPSYDRIGVWFTALLTLVANVGSSWSHAFMATAFLYQC